MLPSDRLRHFLAPPEHRHAAAHPGSHMRSRRSCEAVDGAASSPAACSGWPSKSASASTRNKDSPRPGPPGVWAVVPDLVIGEQASSLLPPGRVLLIVLRVSVGLRLSLAVSPRGR